MARSRNRGNGHKAKSSKTREQFAMIPKRVALSEAFCSLTASAHRLLVLALCQYRKDNNGNIAITRARFKAQGFSNIDTFSRALKELQDHGLIRRTRQGEMSQGTPKPSLYRFTWQPVLAQPEIGVEACDETNEWAEYTAPRKHQKASKPPPSKKRRTDISDRARTDVCVPPDPMFRNPDDSRTDISDRARSDISDTFLRSSPEGHPPPDEVQVEGGLPPSSRINSAPGQGSASSTTGDPGDSQVDGRRDRRGPLSLENHPNAPTAQVIPLKKK